MPQLDLTTFASQIFWLIVTFGVLYLIMAKNALPVVRGVLQNRQSKISNDLQKAEQFKEDAQAAEEDFTSVLSDAKSEAAALINEVYDNVAAEESKHLSKLEETFARQAKEADQRIKILYNESNDKLRPVIAEFSCQVVKKLINVDISAKDADKKVKAIYSQKNS
ncbi:hypothetical protein N9W34_06215 [Rickettsiales bacterium]|nr:hypothetical protein [Rickettsiales bacterium]